MSNLRADYRTAMLGVFAGLFTISVFLLVDRVEMYYEHFGWQDMESHLNHPARVLSLWWMPVALWHVLMFVLASFAAHRYFSDLRDSPFLLWQLVGMGALLAWGLTVASVVVLDTLMHGPGMWLERLMHPPSLRYPAKFVAAVLASNAVCASFLHSAARQYAPEVGGEQ